VQVELGLTETARRLVICNQPRVLWLHLQTTLYQPASHCLILLKPNSYGVQLQPVSPKFELLGMVSWLICSIDPIMAALMGF
jgi:hypothetical protein